MEAAEAANAFTLARKGGFDAAAIAGGCALYAGPDSPLTHALGCGLAGSVAAAEIKRLEEFFFDRDCDAMIDLCPLADGTLAQAVMDRGYAVIEFNNLLARRVTPEDGDWLQSGLEMVEAGAATRSEWLRVLAEGFGAPPSIVENFPLWCSVLLARRDDKTLATAALAAEDRVALLSCDTTLEDARGQGVQASLIRERLARAARAGCDLAMATVTPGSGSHRNYERAGFELIYMRVNFRKARR
jgi:GNAT superfamily N-acetyltransferase